jgi:hypothetical protein
MRSLGVLDRRSRRRGRTRARLFKPVQVALFRTGCEPYRAGECGKARTLPRAQFPNERHCACDRRQRYIMFLVAGSVNRSNVNNLFPGRIRKTSPGKTDQFSRTFSIWPTFLWTAPAILSAWLSAAKSGLFVTCPTFSLAVPKDNWSTPVSSPNRQVRISSLNRILNVGIARDSGLSPTI